MKTMLFIGGIYHIAFAVFHVLFWKLFRWKDELPKLNVINSNVMQILNLRITFIFLVFAYISFFHSTELLTTGIGNFLLLAIALGWLGRAIEQIYFFGLKKAVSVVMFAVFLVGAAIYIYPFLSV
jgi:hypothetical protein